MKSASLITIFGVLLAAVSGLGACKSNPVGRQCFIGNIGDAGADQTIIASPALECQSKTCLHIDGFNTDLCTGDCATDDDCDTDPASPCKSGWACMVPIVVGPFCCRKQCVCRDYLLIPDGGTPPAPSACDETNMANECCNLPGRQGNPAYPTCN
jgi:hypothetical protein